MLTETIRPNPQPQLSRDDLIARGLPIVRRLAFRMVRRLPPSVDVGDLIGAGNEGLLKAAAAYDPTRYPRFEPYAEARIRGAILDELRATDQMTRHGRRQMTEVSRAIRQLTQELGRPPEEDEVASRLEMEIGAYQKLTESLARGPALARLGETDPEEVPNTDAGPALEYGRKEMKSRLAGAIGTLPERTQMVLALYYQEECTQAEIGRILGVTEGRVCQILGEAAARLRAKLGTGGDVNHGGARARMGRNQRSRS